MDKQSIVMSEQGIVMNEQRWEELVNKVKYSLEFVNDYDDYATEGEINLIVSVLKNNIPFDVVSDLSDNEVKL